MLARTVKLKQGVILNPEFHHFDEDEISAESSLLKVFLAVRFIHRFTSPFQLRQLQYSMMLQLAAAEKKKRPACKRATGNAHCPYESTLRHSIVSAHDYTHIFS